MYAPAPPPHRPSLPFAKNSDLFLPRFDMSPNVLPSPTPPQFTCSNGTTASESRTLHAHKGGSVQEIQESDTETGDQTIARTLLSRSLPSKQRAKSEPGIQRENYILFKKKRKQNIGLLWGIKKQSTKTIHPRAIIFRTIFFYISSNHIICLLHRMQPNPCAADFLTKKEDTKNKNMSAPLTTHVRRACTCRHRLKVSKATRYVLRGAPFTPRGAWSHETSDATSPRGQQNQLSSLTPFPPPSPLAREIKTFR